MGTCDLRLFFLHLRVAVFLHPRNLPESHTHLSWFLKPFLAGTVRNFHLDRLTLPITINRDLIEAKLCSRK